VPRAMSDAAVSTLLARGKKKIGWTAVVRFPARGRDFSLLQIGARAHRGRFPWG
jgi:hypothetical protein